MPGSSNETPDQPSRESLLRIAGLLLAACATLLALSAGLGAYILWDKRQLAELKGSLLSQLQLQEALLAGQPSDKAPYPHLDPGLSFVLNPYMGNATWHTAEDLPYRVNRLGLRGEEIKRKAANTTRIALVGDSVLFGWKLGDRDMLATILQQMTDQKLGPGRYEFVTVALPGWNVIDQDAFLRNHLGRLDPDYILWSIIRNDLIDSAGVVPPATLMGWNSPQKTLQQPFQFLPPAHLKDAPAPEIISRWQANLRLIENFSQEHDIPVSLLWWRSQQRLLIEYIFRISETRRPQTVFVPGEYRYDENNWCIAYPDCHPTPWANRRLAVGILDQLVREELLPSVNWSQEEQEIVEQFRREAERETPVKEQIAFMRKRAARAPRAFPQDGATPVLYGLQNGRMQKNGMLLLRAAGEHLTLEMAIALREPRRGPHQSIALHVRSSAGTVAEQTFELPTDPSHISLDLSGGAEFDLYEIHWQFRYAECHSPHACVSAELREVRLRPRTTGKPST